MKEKLRSWVETFRQLNHEFGPRWSLYLAIPISFTLFVMVPLWRQHRETSKPYYERHKVEVLAALPSDLEAEVARIEQAGKTMGREPKAYFQFLEDARRLARICDKARMINKWSPRDQWLPYAQCGGRMDRATKMDVIQSLQSSYWTRFTDDVMVAARKEWEAKEYLKEVSDASAPAAPFIWAAYKGSIPLALFFFVLRLTGKKMSLWLEIAQLWRLGLAALFWPVGIFAYPRGDIRSQLRAARRVATATLSAGLSLFGGVAKASASGTGKDASKKKEPLTLQLDSRINPVVSGGAPDSAFLRATLITRKGILLESVNLAGKNFWYDSSVVGKSFSTPKATIIPIVGVIADSSGSRAVQAGVQVFHAGRHFHWLMPVFNLERQIKPTSSTAFSSAAWALVPLGTGRQAVGMDYSFRKTFGSKEVGWSLGTVFQMKLGRASFWEAGVSRNQAGVVRARLRFAHTFSW